MKNSENVVFHYVILQTHYHFKPDFQKVDSKQRHQISQGQLVEKPGTLL